MSPVPFTTATGAATWGGSYAPDRLTVLIDHIRRRAGDVGLATSSRGDWGGGAPVITQQSPTRTAPVQTESDSDIFRLRGPSQTRPLF